MARTTTSALAAVFLAAALALADPGELRLDAVGRSDGRQPRLGEIVGRGLSGIEADGGRNSSSRPDQVASDATPPTLLQIGSASRLRGAPGVRMQIHFEVTNDRETGLLYRFGAVDELYFLRSLTPQTQWIEGKTTANVVLTVGITSTAERGARDAIEFSATGLERTTIGAYVYVVGDEQAEREVARPRLDYSYRGDCVGHLGADSCGGRSWGLDVVASQTEIGLLRIATLPGGLRYEPGFFAGTRGEARARYSASCCSPRLHVSAADLAGNAVGYDLNVANYLPPALIAAIVLGALLFVVLVVAAALLCRRIIKRNRNTREIPSFQTQRAA